MAQILLLEADKLIAKNLTRVLKRAGHKVAWEVEPQAAMDSSDNLKPDVVVLDLVLAGRGGLEFLYEFRSYPDWQNIPVVLYSQVAREELENTWPELQQLNVTSYHHKPVSSLGEILESVEQVLKAQPVAK